MVSLGDEQDPWALRGREEQSHGNSCPLPSTPDSPRKTAKLLVEEVPKLLCIQYCFYSWNGPAQAGATKERVEAQHQAHKLESHCKTSRLCWLCWSTQRQKGTEDGDVPSLFLLRGEMINSCRKKANAVCLYKCSAQGQCQASNDLGYHLRPAWLLSLCNKQVFAKVLELMLLAPG